MGRSSFRTASTHLHHSLVTSSFWKADTHLSGQHWGSKLTATRASSSSAYAPTQNAFGIRHAEILSIEAAGNAVADLSAVSRMEHDVGPEPSLSGRDDRS